MSTSEPSGCGCYVIYLIISGLLSWYFVDWILQNIFCEDIPWWADLIIGCIGGSIIFPLWVILWILKLFMPIDWGCTI